MRKSERLKLFMKERKRAQGNNKDSQPFEKSLSLPCTVYYTQKLFFSANVLKILITDPEFPVLISCGQLQDRPQYQQQRCDK